MTADSYLHIQGSLMPLPPIQIQLAHDVARGQARLLGALGRLSRSPERRAEIRAERERRALLADWAAGVLSLSGGLPVSDADLAWVDAARQSLLER